CGLFGVRDLASGRQIANLFADGISLSEILRSVKEVRAWLPEADLSNLRLHPAAHRAIEIEQPGGRTDKRGQFVLPVNAPARTPMLYLSKHRQQRTPATLPKPSGCIVS